LKKAASDLVSHELKTWKLFENQQVTDGIRFPSRPRLLPAFIYKRWLFCLLL